MEERGFLNIVSSAFLIIVSMFLISSINSKNNYKAAKAANAPLDKSVKVQGIVAENNMDCTIDGACFLRLLVGNQAVSVVYNLGKAECVNTRSAYEGASICKGDKVEAFGYQHSQDLVSTCEFPEYYIKKLN